MLLIAVIMILCAFTQGTKIKEASAVGYGIPGSDEICNIHWKLLKLIEDDAEKGRRSSG